MAYLLSWATGATTLLPKVWLEKIRDSEERLVWARSDMRGNGRTVGPWGAQPITQGDLVSRDLFDKPCHEEHAIKASSLTRIA
jgi:hypothetical protein